MHLESPRLLLRPFVMDDAARVCELAGEEKLARKLLAIPYPYKIEMAEEWISQHPQNIERQRAHDLAIIDKSNMEVIGAIGLLFELKHQRADLGYWVGLPYWGQGFCTEAAKLMLKLAFVQYGCNKVQASCFQSNPASASVLQKIGMKKEGLKREHFFHWGRFEDSLQFGILRSEWQQD